MNKRMREILSKIEELRGAAKVFRDEKKFEDAQKKLDEIKELQKEYEIEKALFEAEQSSVPENPPASAPAEPTQEEKDEKTFKDFIIGTIASMKAGEQNLGGSNTSSIIPVTIANRIISKVKEISPIYSRATIFHVKGTLKIPVWSDANTSHNINVAYAEEFTELTADSGKFTSIDLGGFLVGAAVIDPDAKLLSRICPSFILHHIPVLKIIKIQTSYIIDAVLSHMRIQRNQPRNPPLNDLQLSQRTQIFKFMPVLIFLFGRVKYTRLHPITPILFLLVFHSCIHLSRKSSLFSIYASMDS